MTSGSVGEMESGNSSLPELAFRAVLRAGFYAHGSRDARVRLRHRGWRGPGSGEKQRAVWYRVGAHSLLTRCERRVGGRRERLDGHGGPSSAELPLCARGDPQHQTLPQTDVEGAVFSGIFANNSLDLAKIETATRTHFTLPEKKISYKDNSCM